MQQTTMRAGRENATMATLRQKREDAKLTREQLAQKTHGAVTASTIYRIETERASPIVAVRHAIAQALGVGVDDIDWPKPKSEGGESGE